ncbi:hypothetical protein L207DRAFT_506723 [Hyaloscypha variabilis F]|uniref:BZIP domain-containing protein n=1 Tax=Hyaloscypha variabilis (strain UAMH 11265 / GT02V1 / F) TaxID=1149755 RepID=A0A2J6SAL2_HYAVF|nr:hypothetical protein L207DRAFT_506723 [Hyaloscypha variabilis F]
MPDPFPTLPVSFTHSKVKVRRERIRLAQRNYRSRREAEFNSVKEKAERAERALGKITKSFAKFQNEAARERQLPPRVAMALSRTALEIMNLSNDVRNTDIEGEDRSGSGGDLSVNIKDTCSERSSEQDNLIQSEENEDMELEGVDTQLPAWSTQSSSDPRRISVVENGCTTNSARSVVPWRQTRMHSSDSIPPQPKRTPLFPYTHSTNLPFAQRLRLGALEKTVQLLSSPTLSVGQIHPTLSLHLKWMAVEPLRNLNQNALFRFPNLELYGPSPHPALPNPDLYRSVEGGGIIVERKWGGEVETLEFGKTRTRVETAMPGFDGDWLEASDVQEYLEDKGVLLTGVEVETELRSAIPEGRLVQPIDPGHGEAPAPSTRSVSLSQSPTANEGTKYKPLDLQILIEYLAIAACCIGPAPAVRKADVDRALVLAVAGF